VSHELDVTEGVASFASHQAAWHRLGTVFDHEMTVEEALEAAHLARWNVRKLDLIGRDVQLATDGVTTVDVADTNWRLAVRTNPITGKVEPFGPVGRNFVHVQNEDHAEFLAALLDMSGARFLSTAGAIKGGRQVFYSARLPETMNIGGRDQHDLYVTALNGHDGSMAFGVIASPIRVVCANTQAAAIRSAAQKWTTRHTKGAPKAIEAARKGLDLAHKFNAEFEREAERMINEQLTLTEFDKITARLFDVKDPQDESPREATFREHRTGTLHTLWHGDTQANIAGTRYAGYNVITEYVDHHSIARGKSEDARSASRAVSAVLGDGFTLKAKAFNAFRVPAAR
jgi:phage/plasmid-like protein (TIGR03299 family)